MLLVVVLAGALWVAGTALLARHDANQLSGEISTLESDFTSGREGQAAALVGAMQHHASAAHFWTSGPAWWVAARVPGLGPLQTVRREATLVDDLASTTLAPALRVGQALDPSQLRIGPDQINLQRLGAATAPLGATTAATQAVLARAQQLPGGGWLHVATKDRHALVTTLLQLHRGLADLTTASRLLPGPLGQDGVRRYFVAFENDAESRGIGGLPGSFAILTADHGRLSFGQFADDDELIGTHANVDLGADFREFYSSDFDFDPEADIRNSDRSPDFPDAAQIWMSMWEQKFHQHLDGAIATDPTALGYLLAAAGQVTLSTGGIVNASDAVRFFESVVYAEFPPNETMQRKAYETAAASAVASQVLHQPSRDLLATASALQRAASQSRLLVYTTDASVESSLASTPLGGELPVTSRPFLDVVVNNTSGTKLDFYLDRSVTYSRASCAAGTATVTVTLHNAAPSSGLPPYVVAAGAPYAPAIAGEDDMIVSLFGTTGSEVSRARLDGKVAYISEDSERGHPVTTTDVSLKPGQTRTVVFSVHEPTATGPVLALSQPLVRPLLQRIHAPQACR